MRPVVVSEDSGVVLTPSVLLSNVDAATAEAGFDAAPDGKSFVVRRDRSRAAGAPALRTRFTLVQNWFNEFAARAKP